MYRPEGWEKLKPDTVLSLRAMECAGSTSLVHTFEAGIEAGADALLEGLKSKTSHPQEVRNGEGKRLGILVFIPGEE